MKNISDRREFILFGQKIIFVDQIQSIEYYDNRDLIITLIDGRQIQFENAKSMWDKLTN